MTYTFFAHMTSRTCNLLSVAIIATTLVVGISFASFAFMKEAQAATDCAPVATRCVGSGQEYTTIQDASTAAQAGDTVVVFAGTYAGFSTARSGTAGSPITITNNGSDTVTINAQVRVDHNYITLNGLTINYTDSYEGGASLRVGYSSQLNHITVTNCQFSANGINAVIAIFYADDVLFESNIVEGPMYFIGLVQSGQRQTVSNNIFRNATDVERIFNVAASNSLWKNNEIYNFNWTGDPRVHSDIWQTINDGSIAQHNILENNYVHDLVDVQTGAIETNSTGTNVNDWTWRNNIFANAGTLYLISGNFKFYNNTYYRTGAANQSAIIVYKDAFGDGSGADFRNNIFLQDTNQGIIGEGAGSPTYSYSNNFVANTDFTARSGWSETGGVNGGNPQFATTSTNCMTTTCNFHITTASAAKDQGATIVSVTVDKDDVARPQGVAYDMGAYEYISAPTAASVPSPANASTSVATSTSLSWIAGNDTASNGIYFGTAASPGASEYKGNQVGTTYDPVGNLATGTTYYWRIDEVNEAGTTTGTVWSFATGAENTADSNTTVANTGGSGTCRNCTSRIKTTTTLATTTTPVVSRCSSVTLPATDLTGNPTLAGIVDLLVSLGIIPPDRTARACTALTTMANNASSAVSPQPFTKPLKYDMTDPDVKRLQVFLNTHGFVVATNGIGAKGQESTYYGAKTSWAVARFQEAYRSEILVPAGLARGSGYFGFATIRKVNELLGR